MEYQILLTTSGGLTVDAYLAPTHDFYGGDDHGIRFAVSLDHGKPVVVDMHADHSTNEHNPNPWRQRVSSAHTHARRRPSVAASRAHRRRLMTRLAVANPHRGRTRPRGADGGRAAGRRVRVHDAAREEEHAEEREEREESRHRSSVRAAGARPDASHCQRRWRRFATHVRV